MIAEKADLGQKALGEEGPWAVALSPSGDKLVTTTCNGKINVWPTMGLPTEPSNQYTTKGSFALCADVVGTILPPRWLA